MFHQIPLFGTTAKTITQIFMKHCGYFTNMGKTNVEADGKLASDSAKKFILRPPFRFMREQMLKQTEN